MAYFGDGGEGDIGSGIRGLTGDATEIKQKALKLYAELKKERKTKEQLAAEEKVRLTNIERGLSKVLENQAAADQKLDVITGAITDLASEMRKECTKLLNAVYEASEVQTPSAFIVLPHRLERPADGDNQLLMLQQNGTIQLSANAANNMQRAESLLKKANKAKDWMGKIAHMASAVAEAVSGGGEDSGSEQVTGAVDALFAKDTVLYLYLIDQLTGDPVFPRRKDDETYPLIITQHHHTVMKKVLPIMNVCIKTAQLLNKGANICKMFGLPFAEVTGALEETLTNVAGKLDAESSVAEFDCLQSAMNLSGNSTGEPSSKNIRGAALRQFAEFLEEHDPKHDFCGLRRIADGEAFACWTVVDDEEIRRLKGK